MTMNHDDDNKRRQIVMSEIMTPGTVNFGGHVHGGHVLQLLDHVAYACASRYSGKLVVTLSLERVSSEGESKVLLSKLLNEESKEWDCSKRPSFG